MSELLRALPHNLDAEIATLGSMMIDGAAIERVSEFLAPDDFYREAHHVIYDALIALSGRNEPVDLVTLSEELQRRGEAGRGRRYRLPDHSHGQRAQRGECGLLCPDCGRICPFADGSSRQPKRLSTWQR
jgi:hypothetical protein